MINKPAIELSHFYKWLNELKTACNTADCLLKHEINQTVKQDTNRLKTNIITYLRNISNQLPKQDKNIFDKYINEHDSIAVTQITGMLGDMTNNQREQVELFCQHILKGDAVIIINE